MTGMFIKKKDNILKVHKKCAACDNKNIFNVMSLISTPFEDHFLKKKDIKKNQQVFPLKLYLCKNCGNLFLLHVLNPNVSYKYYLYNTEVTLGLQKYYNQFAKKIVKKYSLKRKDKMLDIGSNDGSVLNSFKKQKLEVLGIEPAKKISTQANKKKLKTICDFFSPQIASKLKRQNFRPKLITANYVLANINNLKEFAKLAESLLDDNGILIINTGYHPKQFKIYMFDYIYHEHFSYFSLGFLKNFFKRYGLEVVDANLISLKGGSIEIVLKKTQATKKISNRAKKIIKTEQKEKINTTHYFKKFNEKINKKKNDLLNLLKRLKGKKNFIIGFGASHSTTILTYHFELRQFLSLIVDDNKLKHNLFSPGYHIPVVSTEAIYKKKPDFVLILAWQHQKKIVLKHIKYLNQGGKFIIPLPTLKVIDKKNYKDL